MKKLEKSSFDLTKIIGGGLLIIIIALLVAVLVKLGDTQKDISTSKYTSGETIEKVDGRGGKHAYDKSNTNSGSTQIADTSNFISAQEATDVALKQAGADSNTAHDIDVELEKKFDQTVYEVNFDYNQYEYEYYINAENGEIVKVFKEIDY